MKNIEKRDKDEGDNRQWSKGIKKGKGERIIGEKQERKEKEEEQKLTKERTDEREK